MTPHWAFDVRIVILADAGYPDPKLPTKADLEEFIEEELVTRWPEIGAVSVTAETIEGDS